MPMPDFDEAGLLPAGIWDASIEEAGQRFGCFQQNDQRPRLWRKMQAFLHEVQGTNLVEAIILVGSF